MAAAVELMLDRDYDSLQMKDVAAAASVALGTMYRYFNSKDHVIAEALLMWAQRFPEPPATGEPAAHDVERIKAAFRRAVRAFERHPTVYSHLAAVQATSDPLTLEVYNRFSARQLEAFAAFLDRVPSQRREAIVRVMSAVLDANLRDWTLGRHSIDDVYDAIDSAAELLAAR